jgi:glycosyltransferase involved in cell wall biosynthesis
MGRSLRGRFSGVVRYTDDLLRALAPRLKDDLTVFLTRAEDGLNGLPIRRVRAPFSTPNEYARALWEQGLVPIAVRRSRAELFHSPNYILPVGLRCPTVVTVHDLAFLQPELHRLRSHLYLTVLASIAIRKATRVICVSNHTRDQLLMHFPRAAPKVRVIGEGVNAAFRPQPADMVRSFRASVGLGPDEPYVLFVGTVEPRKNLPRLIRAFESALRDSDAGHRLLIVGGWGWKAQPVQEAYRGSGVRHRITFAGYVPDRLLPAAYSGADVFAYPSLHEGFGLPPLEAMACATAVLTSTATAIPEVVGDGAVTVDPEDDDAIAAGLARLMTCRAVRDEYVARGLRRAAGFSWEGVAERTLRVYEEAVG